MPVVSAGLSPHSDNSPDAFGYREFIERLYELGAAQRADAIGIHPYPGVGPNDDYLGDALIQLGKYQIEMRQAGKPAPMWATEFGISTTGRHAFAPEHQARALPELYELFRRVDRVDVAIIHRLVDASHAGGSEAGYGVLHDGLGLKPALCGLALLRGLGC